MTDSHTNPQSSATDDTSLVLATRPAMGCRVKKYTFWIVVFVCVALGIAMIACPWFLRARADVAPLQAQLVTLDQQIQALDARVTELDHRLGTMSAAVVPSETADSAASVAINALQKDVAVLTETVRLAQAQRQQTPMAAMFAYIHLREAAMAGYGFADELTALRAVAPPDLSLDALTPHAAQGVPTIAMLRETLGAQESTALRATETAEAQTGWQRAWVAIKGLVTVRALHGGESDRFVAVETALAKGDVAAARTAFDALAPEAQTILAVWRAQLDARVALNDALRQIAVQLAAPSQAAP